MTSSIKNLIAPQEWDAIFADFQPKVVTKVKFADLFPKFLKPDPHKRVLEIGCAGGKFLCYLAKTFQFQPYGLDFGPGLEHTRATFRVNGLPEPVLFAQDFFAWQTEDRFDLVCSFGFVEHFADLAQVLRKHADLVAPGGMLIFSMPHFAHLQYLFHWLIDRENLSRHNTKIMNLAAIRRAFQGLPFTIQYLSYYHTFYFRTAKAELKPWEKVVEQIIRRSGRRLRKTIGQNRPNFLLSPEIICVAARD